MKASAMPANEFAPRPTSPGAYLYLLPVFTALIAAVWLGELPGPYIVAGGALALLGTYLASG